MALEEPSGLEQPEVGAPALPRVKSGTLRFWGSWFGRPHDNHHEIVGGQAEGDLLTVRFNEDEVLRIWAPRGATIDENHFRIVDANRVRWEWFYYGRPKIPSNLYFEEFTTDGAEIRVETNVDGTRRSAGRIGRGPPWRSADGGELPPRFGSASGGGWLAEPATRP